MDLVGDVIKTRSSRVRPLWVKGKLICDIDNIASYVIAHDSANVLGGTLSSIWFVKKVCLIGPAVKGNTCLYFETMREGVDPALNAQVVV